MAPSGHGLILADPHGLAKDGILAEDKRGLDLIFRLFELSLANRLRPYPTEQAADRALHIEGLFIGHPLGGDGKARRVRRQSPVIRVHAAGDSFLVDQILIESRAAAASQNHREQIQSEAVRMLEIGGVIVEEQERQLGLFLEAHPPLSPLRRLPDLYPGRPRAPRDVAE